MKKLNIKIVLAGVSFSINALLVKNFSTYELSLAQSEKETIDRIEVALKNIVKNIPEATGVNRTEEWTVSE